MLKTPANTFRSRGRLAVGLSWVAGYTNVTTLVAAAQTVSHQTGNVTHLGQTAADAVLGRPGSLAEAAYFAGLVACFAAGAFASGVLTAPARRAGRRSRFVLPLALETALLAAVVLVLARHPHPDHGRPLVAVTFTAAAAMGLQNATVTRISGAVVRTTHLTGVTTDLGLELATVAAALADAARGGRGRRALRRLPRHPAVGRAALLAGIFASFLTGAALGALAHHAAAAAGVPAVALLVPVLFLTALVARELLADVAAINPVEPPPDLAGVLPATVGLFRLTHRRPGRPDHPPDLAAWAGRLDRRLRVAVLSVDPQTRFHADAAVSLLSAAALLRAGGRTLLVVGMGRPQLKLLRRHDPHHRLKWHDFPPDLEFAVARALSLTDPDA